MKPFIIAEIGVNHDGNLMKAKTLIDEAIRSGACAVKFQSFSAKRLSSIDTPKVAYQNTRDVKRSHYEMLKELELTFNEQKMLFDYSTYKKIEFISTPYSVEDAIFLNELGVKKFKVASADIIDIPLHQMISSYGKLTLISTGMASKKEISEVMKIYQGKNCPVVLLQTTSEYPSPIINANLSKLNFLKSLNPYAVGYSDHTKTSICAVTSVGIGATYFEKHFTLKNSDLGPDHYASLEPKEFKDYVNDIEMAFTSLGNEFPKRTAEEENMAETSRKSLHYAKDMKSGFQLLREDFLLVRPGTGLPYSFLESVIYKKLSRDVSKFEIVTKEDFI